MRSVSLVSKLASLTAHFPLRIASHRKWKEQLTVDSMIPLGAMMVAALAAERIVFPSLQAVHVPQAGIVNALVEEYHLEPVQMLAFGTLYFGVKALVNAYRTGNEYF